LIIASLEDSQSLTGALLKDILSGDLNFSKSNEIFTSVVVSLDAL
jgi:hypothetical protein